MSQQTSTAEITSINSFYNRDLLFRATPLLVHNRYGQVKDVPENNSMTIKFKRYGVLSAATTALVEGVTPAGSKLSETIITGTLQQYGDFITLTDRLTMTTQDPVRTEANSILGAQAGLTLDSLTRDVIVAGTNVVYAGSGHTLRTQVAAGELITVAMLQSAEETLKGNSARYMTSFVDPSTGYNTVPLPPCFIGICHVYTTKTLRGLTGFTKVELYAQPGDRMVGEIGKLENTRFIETVNAKVFTAGGASSIDVYATLILSQEAYATSRIGGNGLVNIVKELGSAGAADPLNQRETSGWKATFTATILNDNFMVRLEHARV